MPGLPADNTVYNGIQSLSFPPLKLSKKESKFRTRGPNFAQGALSPDRGRLKSWLARRVNLAA